MNLQEQISRMKSIMNIVESDDFTYTDPNFDTEWQEAQRYVEHPDRKSTRLNSSHVSEYRMPSSA